LRDYVLTELYGDGTGAAAERSQARFPGLRHLHGFLRFLKSGETGRFNKARARPEDLWQGSL
jgi:hypothetical protein